MNDKSYRGGHGGQEEKSRSFSGLNLRVLRVHRGRPLVPGASQFPDHQMRLSAVFFDVDFTLIYPGPMFQGEGYRAFCARYGMEVDPAKFATAVANAAPLLDGPEDSAYNADIFIAYTRHIIEQMGGCGPHLNACAREIYDEWAACQHFELYDDVPVALRSLAGAGLRIGLISNTQRCLTSFQSHFELEGFIAAAVSSYEHGYMKPHPSIFSAALAARRRTAGRSGDGWRQRAARRRRRDPRRHARGIAAPRRNPARSRAGARKQGRRRHQLAARAAESGDLVSDTGSSRSCTSSQRI